MLQKGHEVVPQELAADLVVAAGPEGALTASRALLATATAVVVVNPTLPQASTSPATPDASSSASATPTAAGSASPTPTTPTPTTPAPSPDPAADAAPLPDLALAGQVAQALGVPLFLAGPGLLEELDRLQTRVVIGYPAEGLDVGSREVLPFPASVQELPKLDGLPAQPKESGVLALAAEELSAPVAATLAAAGVRTNPVAYPHPGVNRQTTEAVRAATGPIVGVGAGFGTSERLTANVGLTRTAAEMPGGGVLPFPGRRMIAFYGHPETAALGMMGEQSPAEAVTRLKKLVAEYQALLPDDQVIGAFEIITTVASAYPTGDGDYSYETPIDLIMPWVEAAEANDLYVVLDLQPGRTDFLTQAKRYEELLKRPWVGLALDPEWRLKPDERHLVSIGQVGVDEVNQVGAWLADLVKAHNLPPKVLTLHQFQTRMIIDRHRLDTSRDEVQYLVHVDGQGGQEAKQGTWGVMRRNLPERTWLGWKNFEDEDIPMLTPAQTVQQVQPTPNFISYQ